MKLFKYRTEDGLLFYVYEGECEIYAEGERNACHVMTYDNEIVFIDSKANITRHFDNTNRQKIIARLLEGKGELVNECKCYSIENDYGSYYYVMMWDGVNTYYKHNGQTIEKGDELESDTFEGIMEEIAYMELLNGVMEEYGFSLDY